MRKVETFPVPNEENDVQKEFQSKLLQRLLISNKSGIQDVWSEQTFWILPILIRQRPW